MAYFTNFPKVSLPSFSDNRRSSGDFVSSINLFKRGKIRDDIFRDVSAFEKYIIIGDERPDNVAFKLFGDSKLDWVVLISNNIINVRDEWPMSQYDFKRYVDNKYGSAMLTQIHHYETKEVRDQSDRLLQEKGLIVDENYTFTWTEKTVIYSSSDKTSVTNLEFEERRNDKKRTIFVVRPRYLEQIKQDMRDLLTYKDSSQYINRKLKRGSNQRILAPRVNTA